MEFSLLDESKFRFQNSRKLAAPAIIASMIAPITTFSSACRELEHLSSECPGRLGAIGFDRAMICYRIIGSVVLHRAVRTINITRRVLVSPEETVSLRSLRLTGDLEHGALRCTTLLIQSKRPDPFSFPNQRGLTPFPSLRCVSLIVATLCAKLFARPMQKGSLENFDSFFELLKTDPLVASMCLLYVTRTAYHHSLQAL